MAREGGQPAKPAIVVLSAADGPVEHAVLAGIEEEGVPYTVQRVTDGRAAPELARDAAGRAPLGVGVGVDTRGGVCAHQDKLPAPVPGLMSDGADPDVARALGHNAARIVVGLPLKRIADGG
ncbi:glycerol dehydratase reactivase beta/small subunit family protein [Mycobacterium sp. PS03-16]|uniref:glycerol dehydratase reactivase beta/small subunit family protein n=1 Tax=Mycobacterium sp. PS03-16 TaxID=2559611 RepID=UPI001FD76393|nr:glycerol dehydratase reactivase beta/small subunit family protein [Mycobacterium sp. PS03-16]